MVRKPRIGLDLVHYLSAAFPPRCIGPNEDLRAADRYAGKVELAQMLIRMGQKDEDHDVAIQED